MTHAEIKEAIESFECVEGDVGVLEVMANPEDSEDQWLLMRSFGPRAEAVFKTLQAAEAYANAVFDWAVYGQYDDSGED